MGSHGGPWEPEGCYALVACRFGDVHVNRVAFGVDEAQQAWTRQEVGSVQVSNTLLTLITLISFRQQEQADVTRILISRIDVFAGVGRRLNHAGRGIDGALRRVAAETDRQDQITTLGAQGVVDGVKNQWIGDASVSSAIIDFSPGSCYRFSTYCTILTSVRIIVIECI